MKSIYFPAWWDIHDGRLSRTGTDKPKTIENYYAGGRSLFGDYGRLGCVTVDKNLNAISQFSTENPIKYKEQGFYFIKKDEVANKNENPHLFITKRKDMLFSLNYLRKNIETSATSMRRKNKREMEIFKELNNTPDVSFKNLQKNSAFLPTFMKYLIDRPDLFYQDNIENASKLSSPMYSGGCIKIFILQNKNYLVYSDGDKLSKLSINRFDVSNNCLERTSIQQFKISKDDNPIFQVDAVSYSDFTNILVRCESCAFLISVFESDNDICISRESSVNSMGQFLSCKLSPFKKADLATTFEDYFNLYDTDRLEVIWNKDITCYSSVMDNWNELQPGSYPRTWLVTNRSTSKLYDCRKNPFTESGLELFSTSIKSLSSQESIYHATNIFSDYYFYLFTTFNAILVDIRSPMLQVSQWTMPTMSPASYSSISSIDHMGQMNFTIGCQSKAKHVLFHHQIDNYSKSTCVASKSDWDTDSIMSLGLDSHINNINGIVTVFTLDNNGSVLGNQYQLKSDTQDYHTLPTPSEYRFRSTKRFKENPESIKVFGGMETSDESKRVSFEPYDHSDYNLIKNILTTNSKYQKDISK